MKKSELFELTLASIAKRSNMTLQEYFKFVEECRKLDEDETSVHDFAEDYEGDA